MKKEENVTIFKEKSMKANCEMTVGALPDTKAGLE